MRVSRRLILALCLCLTARCLGQLPDRPIPAIQRVLIVTIDGLRPDLALRADTPTIHALITEGAFTFWARTTAESITLPTHVSMLTGVTPIRHTIQWNTDLALVHPIYPKFPTLFELAKHAGYTTAMAAGKDKFDALAVPGSLDWQYIPDTDKALDSDVMPRALAMLREHQPQVMFVHLPSVDNVGHAAGWASAEQMKVISNADRCVGQLLQTLDDLHIRDQTMFILTSDHGGAGLSHGPDDPRSRAIPWIVVGPGIRRGVDLTKYDKLNVDIEDTFCTACYVLGLHPTKLPLDGKVVMEIFDRTGEELIHNN